MKTIITQFNQIINQGQVKNIDISLDSKDKELEILAIYEQNENYRGTSFDKIIYTKIDDYNITDYTKAEEVLARILATNLATKNIVIATEVLEMFEKAIKRGGC